MSSKAQLEINETILVIIIFSVLAIAGLVVFHRYNTESIKASILESERLSFYDLLNQVPNMPELKCSSQNIQDDCIDLYKAFGLSKLQLKYFDKFGYKTINLRFVYPTLPDKECTESLFQATDFPNCNRLKIYERIPTNYKATEKISSPVAIYNPVTQDYMLAVLELTWQY